MSFLRIKTHGNTTTEVDEYLISSAADVADLPTDAPAGTIAATADLSYVARKDMDGTWAAVIGGGTTPDAED